MDTEIQNFIKIWLTAIASLIFCHQIAARIPAGAARLISLLPIIYLFTTFPLRLHYINLFCPTFFNLSWLGNFKLILFSFNQGPLSTNPPLSLLHFVSIGLFPIKPKQTVTADYSPIPKINRMIIFLVKQFLLAGVVYLYHYIKFMHPYLVLTLKCCHMYLGAELLLAITAAPVRAVLGLQMEPQFDEPYKATSLQDFWGQRWNLMVSAILRPAVYHPVHRVSTRLFGGRWARDVATAATFLVSGLMHEVIYYYVMRASPTWEVTWFFVLHGVCVSVEVWLKKAALRRGWRLHGAVSGALTLGFVVLTSGWLFFPQTTRNGLDLRVIDEYSIFLRWIRDRCNDLNALFFAKTKSCV